MRGEAGNSSNVDAGLVVGVEDEVTCIKIIQGKGQVFGLPFFFFFSNPLLYVSGYRTPRSTSRTCTCELEQIYEYGS